jgi:hypothetical protein
LSHTTTIETKLLDPGVLQAACTALGIACTLNSEAKLYDNSRHQGTVIQLPGWKFPIIVKADGSVAADNFKGNWGKIDELNKLKQEYATEAVRRELRKKGLRFREVREDGRVKLIATVGA